ncbi:hypothetical protein [Actinoallomurus iriomotensis]|uniref:Uncharacterized protein n=1 Tax=Actinoallomurus iriomotensis TaxID=478107 RepID=A0A9W6SCY4_9ACTN|nr:hypothetical protein [Actinoallomurus iriomotensis]GLY91303.1 hypothetical protein Airi02_092320 [Actinoallomurus iriomotensis]
MRLLRQLVPVVVVAFVGGQLVSAVQDNAFLCLILGLATAVLAVFVYAWTVRWSERRTPAEVAAKGAAARIGLGALIGVGWFAAVIVNIAFLSDYRVDRFGSVADAVGLFGFMAAAAGVPVTIAFLWPAHRRGNLVPRRRGARITPTATLAQ